MPTQQNRVQTSPGTPSWSPSPPPRRAPDRPGSLGQGSADPRYGAPGVARTGRSVPGGHKATQPGTAASPASGSAGASDTAALPGRSSLARLRLTGSSRRVVHGHRYAPPRRTSAAVPRAAATTPSSEPSLERPGGSAPLATPCQGATPPGPPGRACPLAVLRAHPSYQSY